MNLLLIIDTMIHYDREILKGIKSKLDEVNMNLSIHIDSVENEDYLFSKEWDYVIADFDKVGSKKLANRINSRKVVIYSSAKIEETLDRVSSIINDNEYIANIALSQFINDGIRHVSVYSDNDEIEERWAIERKESFYLLANKTGCEYFSDIYKAIVSHEQKIGVFCTSDRSARKFIRYCLDNNVDVPNQVSIIGTDYDELEREMSQIPISSVELNPKLLGRRCAELVLDLKGKNVHELYQAKQLHADYSSLSVSTTHALVNRALLYIHNHYHRNIKVQQITDYCRVSRKTLDKRFIDVKGMTVHQYLSDVRISRSKQLLKDESSSIDSIARQCGYPNQSYLNQVYKRIFGYSPSEYRMRCVD